MASPDASPSERQRALQFAYMYGYPLLEYGKYVASFPSDAAADTIYHDRRLSTSADLKVVRPNVDTLYSTIFLDLSSQDLVITVPNINDDRYWVFPFYDPYGNDIANIGSLQGHKAGKYLVRYATEAFGFFPGSPPEGDDGYQGYVNLPTAYGICLVRIATTPAAEDQKAANRYQDQIRLASVARLVQIAPALDLSIFRSPEYRPSETVSIPQAVLRLTAAFAADNPSPILQDRSWIAGLLVKAGIESGSFTMPPETDLFKVSNFAESQALAALKTPGGRLDHGNGWGSSYPQCLGNFGSNYAARYSIARRGYLALTIDQAVYPSLSAALVLGPNEAILLRFSRRPALVPSGFWSLTAYNAEQYLVPNRLNRYSLGDRDKMVFVDGTPLDVQSKDGEFQILLQPADLTPPTKWMSNWLPVPSGGGKFSITLRWYGVKDAMMTRGEYEYPKIEYVAAITEPRKSML